MASIHLEGILVDSVGEIDVGGVITFTHLTTTGGTIASTQTELIIPPDGAYSIDVEYGQIRIDYTTRYTENFIANVIVNSDSTATSIPELLSATTPVTEPIIIEMQGLVADAVTAEAGAVAAATTAEAFADQLTTTEMIASSAVFSSNTKITTKGYTTSGDGGSGSWIQNGVTGQTVSQSPTQLGEALLNDASGNQWALQLDGAINIRALGAVGDGAIDDTMTIEAALSSSSKILIPDGTFYITNTITKDIIKAYGSGTVTGDFDGYLFDVSGTAPSGYNHGSVFDGLTLINSNMGTYKGSSGILDIRYTGLLTVNNCYMNTNTIGVICTETISARFHGLILTGDSGINPNKDLSIGIYGQGRNCNVSGGRAYGFNVCTYVSGDAWVFDGWNAEWSVCIIRTAAIGSIRFSGCHFESSGTLFTNAIDLPDTDVSPWQDTTTGGTGISGAATFENCVAYFKAVGSNNGAHAPLFVIKSQAGFTFNINITGCAFNQTDGLATISNSFDRTDTTVLQAGTKCLINGSTGFVRPTSIPTDSYSNYEEQNLSSAHYTHNSQTPNVIGTTAYGAGGVITGLTRLSLWEASYKFEGGDLYGYTRCGLRSSYYGQGVEFEYAKFQPTIDNTITLGVATNRWSVVFSNTGTINTSDDREKTYIEISEAETLVATELKTAMRKFQFNDAIEEKGTDNARIHFGTSAQTVVGIFENHGLDASRYGLLCYDEWEDEYEQILSTPSVEDEDGNIIVPPKYVDGDLKTTAGNRYGIRYEELLCFIVGAM